MTAIELTRQFFQWYRNLGVLEQRLCVVPLCSGMQITYLSYLVAANTARDVGGRLVAIAIWGTRANGGRYAAIAALTNIVATVAAYAFYEFVLRDSSRGM